MNETCRNNTVSLLHPDSPMCALTRKPITPQQAMIRLETLCASSEQCTYELRQKLFRWGVGSSDSEKIIESLQRRKFVNDERFTEAYVRDKYRFGKWGRRKIAMALAQKHIDRHVVADALDAIDEDEYAEILISVMRSKARGIKEGNTFEGRTKLFRSVASRGYETSLISSYIALDEIWGNQ